MTEGRAYQFALDFNADILLVSVRALRTTNLR